jgi:hypothetical protein
MTFLKHRGKQLVVAGMAGVLALLVFASLATAASHHPTGEYEQFGECPLNNENINDCIFSVSNGGFFTVGKKEVPLKNPVTLQGGFEGESSEIKFYGAENGDTLSKTAQPVPGGLLGITAPTWWPKFIQEWFNNLINEGFTGVTATVELAGPTKGFLPNVHLNTENLIFGEGTALGLPTKIHLQNAILGSNCYIGSDSSPVQINFTTGTDGKLKGNPGTVTFNKTFTITTVSGGKLVNNSFAAPGVNGCGGIFSFFVDPLVNSILGTPSPSGSNSAVLEGKLQDAAAPAVKASE